MNTEIFRASLEHIDQLAHLFGAYRVFYEQKPAPDAEIAYLQQRMQQGECTVFLARHAGETAGFVLLYPTFDSVELSPVWVLHDLYVDTGFRQKGIGRRLMETAHEYCRTRGGSRVDLSTAVTNTVAQPLYESMGYERDTEFYSYSFKL